MSSPTRYVTIAELNDMAEAIMEELQSFRAAVEERFGVIEARFGVVDARMDNIEGRFDRLEARFDGMDGRVDGLEARLANVEGALFVIGQVLRKVYPDEFGEVEGSGA